MEMDGNTVHTVNERKGSDGNGVLPFNTVCEGAGKFHLTQQDVVFVVLASSTTVQS